MQKISENDLLELWMGERGGRLEIMHHEKMQTDSRARFVMELVKLWGGSQIYSNAISDLSDAHMDQPHKSRPNRKMAIEHMVFVACDTADTLYAELERRGWLLKSPTFGAVMDAADQIAAGAKADPG